MPAITNNQAAWIPKEKARVEVGPGLTPNPAENEVVIEVSYAAVNPTDWKVSIPNPNNLHLINKVSHIDARCPLLPHALPLDFRS